MAGAPAYRFDTYGNTAAQPRPERRPDISVIPGRGPLQTIDPRWKVVLRVCVAVILILAIGAFVRLEFGAAATSASITHDELELDLNTARAEGSSLEVQASNLSNPAYVREYASSKLGMSAPVVVETMTLGEDVVAVDDSGALSLSGSVAAVGRG